MVGGFLRLSMTFASARVGRGRLGGDGRIGGWEAGRLCLAQIGPQKPGWARRGGLTVRRMGINVALTWFYRTAEVELSGPGRDQRWGGWVWGEAR